jgi:hypothetical protein
MVAREAIVLAAREVIVLIAIMAFLAWAARKVVRESRRDREPAAELDEVAPAAGPDDDAARGRRGRQSGARRRG